jgi:hypothetical protein
MARAARQSAKSLQPLFLLRDAEARHAPHLGVHGGTPMDNEYLAAPDDTEGTMGDEPELDENDREAGEDEHEPGDERAEPAS